MNAERLHAIALALNAEIENQATALSNLTQALKRLVSSPSDGSIQGEVTSTRTAVDVVLHESVTKAFSPAWQEVLKECNIANLLGDRLKARIDDIFQSNQVTPAVAYEGVKKLSASVDALVTATNALISGFDFYEIGDERLEPGECELGFLIPRKAVHNQLDDLGKEFYELNRILAPFLELAIGSRPPITVRSISASDFSIYLLALPRVAACLAKTMSDLIAAYKNLLEIKKLRNELLERGLVRGDLEKIETHADRVMETTVEVTVSDLMHEYGGNLNPHRKNELTVELKYSLNSIAVRIDRGYNIEVRAQPPAVAHDGDEDPQNAADVESFNSIKAAQPNLEFIHHDGVPILSLPTAKPSDIQSNGGHFQEATSSEEVSPEVEKKAIDELRGKSEPTKKTSTRQATPRKKKAPNKRSPKRGKL